MNETEAKALAAKQALERELERKRVLRAYSAIPDLVLEDIDREGFVGRALAGPGEIDPYRMAMNEGARVLALRIREKVRLGKEIDKEPQQTKAVSETARGDS